jgi:uncharacterized protein YciI
MKCLGYVAYTKDAAKIAAHRPSHRQYLSSLLERGKLLAAGPFTDDSGALFIYEADSVEAAAQLLAGDPFSVNGVITSAEIKPWKLVMSNAESFKI